MEQNTTLTHFSQHLRKNATKEENILWYQYLRNPPIQFRRQVVFGNYIVDFYCAKALLVIELDGSQHFTPEALHYDFARNQYLESLGLKVMRIENTEIHRNLRGVYQAIDLAVKERYQPGPASNGYGRNTINSGDLSPHPPPPGAPSPRGKVIRTEEI